MRLHLRDLEPRDREPAEEREGRQHQDNWLARSVFAAKFAERNFLLSNVIGENSKILFNRDPAERVEAVAPWLTTDASVYPAIVNKRMEWIVDGYTTLDNYPVFVGDHAGERDSRFQRGRGQPAGHPTSR